MQQQSGNRPLSQVKLLGSFANGVRQNIGTGQEMEQEPWGRQNRAHDDLSSKALAKDDCCRPQESQVLVMCIVLRQEEAIGSNGDNCFIRGQYCASSKGPRSIGHEVYHC